MTTIPATTRDVPQAQASSNYLTAQRGVLSWLITLDHKRIGVMYMVAVLASFALGGAFAILLRTELISPGPTLIGDASRAWDFYNHMFTLHGAVMVFMFIIPAIPAILGNFVLPIMLGAKDVAFPRLNLLSFYIYALGGLFFAWILIAGVLETAFGIDVPGGGGLDTGWTFYTPYSTTTGSGVVPAVMGAFILGFSSILTGVNFIASMHMLRPPGMSWFRMPLLLWALYGTSVIQVLATPVLAITLLLLFAERTLSIGIFDPGLGGDPILFQHFFWFYSHPAVYIMILPAMGVISEIISVFSRKHIFGYRFIAYSSIAIALLGFLVWGHHMFTSGQSAMANAVFSLLTFSVSIPSAIKVFNWISTMYKGDIHLNTPMLYALGFIVLFSIGGVDRVVPGRVGHRHSPARYLLHRGPFSLCDDGQYAVCVLGRDVLLVAEDVRADVQ
jgi:cytochrome c oxidase subunit 1